MKDCTELKWLLIRQTTLKQRAVKTGTIEDEDAWLTADEYLNEYLDGQDIFIEQAALSILFDREKMHDALVKIIEMNRQHAEDQYGDPDKAESWSCVTVSRAALNKEKVQ